MYIFARVVTPFIALAVLIIGLISASFDLEGSRFKYRGFMHDEIQTYFLAKTLFCSTALFLLGQLLAEIILMNQRRDRSD